MPLYEYKCDQCGQVFEVIQRFSDEPLKTHESCGGAVQRLLSAPALQFKGSGWYVNDYAPKKSGSKDKPKDGAPGKTETPAASTTPAASSSSSSTDTK